MILDIKTMKENQKKLLGRKGKLIKDVGLGIPVGTECKVVGYDTMGINLIIEVDSPNGWDCKMPTMIFVDNYRVPEDKSLLYANETEIELY